MPCAFLWLLSPVEYMYNLRNRARGVTMSWVFISKAAVTLALIVAAAVELGNDIWLQQRQEETPVLLVGADFIAAGSKAITYAFSLILMLNTKKSGRITSPIQVRQIHMPRFYIDCTKEGFSSSFG